MTGKNHAGFFIGIVLALIFIVAAASPSYAFNGNSSGYENSGKIASALNDETDEATAKKAEPCPKCGHVKGSELCCKPGQKKCSGCGLVKGSPGCCKMCKGAEKTKQ